MLKQTEYQPIQGFYDLREYNLSATEFKKLWKIQRTLKFIEDRKEYYMKFDLNTWQKAQIMSAEYQQILFSKGKKKVIK